MRMLCSPARLVVAAVVLIGSALQAAAHPHVFIKVRSQLLAKDGALVGFRHTWVFDELWLENQLMEHDKDKDGNLTPAELEALAAESKQTLEMFKSFTVVRAGGALIRAVNPRDVVVEYDGPVLAMSFTANLAKPVPLTGDVQLEVYDQTFFSGFTLESDGFKLAGDAPGGCTIRTDAAASPQQMNVWRMVKKQMGPEFNDKAGVPKSVVVSCPRSSVGANDPMAVHQPLVNR